MNTLKAGFSRLQITPPLGIGIGGYFKKRNAEQILDDLYISTVVVSAGGKTAAIVSLDLLNARGDCSVEISEYAAEKTGLPFDAIYIHCTHTHTSAFFYRDHEGEMEREYFKLVKNKIADSIIMAMEDLKPARLGYAKSMAPRISFGRRYRMKDGTIKTNPGVNNPDIVESVTEIDESVSVIRFTREGADDIAIINFATHPDVIGGNVISADWPGFVRTTFENALGDVKTVFLNGAQGDVNHVNVSPLPGEENGLHKDFDDVDRGYEHSKHMGRTVAGAALQVWTKVHYVDVDSIKYKYQEIEVPSNIPDPSEIPLAQKYSELHKAGRDDEIPYKGMMLTTEVARANRIMRLKDGPASFTIPLSALIIGNVAFLGIAGEPFSGIGISIKEQNPDFDMVMVNCLVNGSKGYFPMMNSYIEGGYESASSSFKAGVAEVIIEKSNELLTTL